MCLSLRAIQGSFAQKVSPFSSISLEMTNMKNNADEIDFLMQDNKIINFFQRFCPEEEDNTTNIPTNSEKIDLTLKLSLDKPHGQNAEEKILTRASSIAVDITQSIVPNGPQGGSSVPSLDKSCSLPAEVVKGLMQFEDLQTMRRAKNRKRLRLGKQDTAKAAKAEKSPAMFQPPPADDQQKVTPEVIAWAAASASKNGALNRALYKIKALAKPYGDSEHEGPRGFAVEGVSSSFLISPKQEKYPMVSPKTMVKEMPPWPAETMLENPLKKVKLENPCSLEGVSMHTLREMPSVTTTGDGPNGKRMKGFLHKYNKGQICIICVCHGSFLSPEEFVMHAGGKDVANPMKHITICSDSF